MEEARKAPLFALDSLFNTFEAVPNADERAHAAPTFQAIKRSTSRVDASTRTGHLDLNNPLSDASLIPASVAMSTPGRAATRAHAAWTSRHSSITRHGASSPQVAISA